MKPAARVDDTHDCPLVEPPMHLGGEILAPAAGTVLVGDKLAARISDLASCIQASDHDVVAQGAATVLIVGLCAARKTDATAHGGAIVEGMDTVLIGGAEFTARKIEFFRDPVTGEWRFKYGTSIVVRPDTIAPPFRYDPNYQSKTLQALIRLDSTPTMHGALDALERTGKTVTIENYHDAHEPFNATAKADHVGDSLPRGLEAGEHIGTGRGSSSTIRWNPDIHTLGGPPGLVEEWQAPGSDVVLGHELIHGVHNATGTAAADGVVDFQCSEERATVGFPAQSYNDPDDLGVHGTSLPDTTHHPFTEQRLREDYRRNGIVSPVTGRPPVPRPSYHIGGKPY